MSSSMDSSPVLFYEFDEFRFEPKGRLLFLRGEPVDITPKALEILLVLVEADGRAVTKDELIERVWPDSFVEEANLSYTIYKLRRALGETDERRFITTLPKRGYRFARTVKTSTTSESNEAKTSAPAPDDHSQQASLRGRAYPVLMAAALFLVLVAAAAAVWYYTRDRPVAADTSRSRPSDTGMTVVQQTTNGNYSCAAISPDGKFIAYFQGDEKESSLAIRQTGANTDRLLFEPKRFAGGGIEFSHDSQSIFYAAAAEQTGVWDIFRVSVLGGEPSRLLSIDDNLFSISPDDKNIYFYRFDAQQRKTEIVASSLDGSTRSIVYSMSNDEMLFDGLPSISPDGRRIAFAADRTRPLVENGPRSYGLFSLDLATKTFEPLTGETWRGVGTISWMTDGSGLVMAASRPPDGNQLYHVSLPQGVATQLTKEFGHFGNFGASVTADGKLLVGDRSDVTAKLWEFDVSGAAATASQITNGEADGVEGVAVMPNGSIVYAGRFGNDLDIWILSEKAGKREGRPLTSDTFFDCEPTVSPDGSTIVFVSNRAGSRHLFSIRPDGSGITQLTSGDGRDSSPDLTPDGKWIVYSSRLNGQSRIWKIATDGGGEPVQVTDFESVAPSVSANGKMIACVNPIEHQTKSSSLVIVSSEDGHTIHSFETVPFSYRYGKALWTAGDRSVIYQGDAQGLRNLWEQPISDAKPHQLTSFDSDQIQYFALTPDRRKIVASRLSYQTNVVLLKNFAP